MYAQVNIVSCLFATTRSRKSHEIEQLQRHGARFPTSGATTGILAALNKLQSATNFTDPRLDFLRNYTYTLGKNGDLVPFGAFQ